jgi:hypothetical protein
MIPTSDLQPGVRTKRHKAAIQAAVADGVRHGSGVAWTILRMTVYMDTLLDAAKRAIASGSYAAPPVLPPLMWCATILPRPDTRGLLITPRVRYRSASRKLPRRSQSYGETDCIYGNNGRTTACSGWTADGIWLTSLRGFRRLYAPGRLIWLVAILRGLSGKRAESVAEFFGRMIGAAPGDRVES